MAIKIARDKKKHFYVGIALGFLLQLAAWYIFPLSPVYTVTGSFVVLASICYGFELFSLVTGKGVAENMDAIAGILGGVIGMLVFWAGLKIFYPAV